MSKLCLHKLSYDSVGGLERRKKKKEKTKREDFCFEFTNHWVERMLERTVSQNPLDIQNDIIEAIEKGNVRYHTYSNSYRVYGKKNIYVLGCDLGVKTILYRDYGREVDRLSNIIPHWERKVLLDKIRNM